MQPNLQAFMYKVFLFSVLFLSALTPQYVVAQGCTNIYQIWMDCSGDGQHGIFENGLQGVNVTLYNASCIQIKQVTTDVNGNYTFGTLSASTSYYAVFGNGQFANGVLNVNGNSHNLTVSNTGAETTDSDAQLGGASPSCASGKPYISFTTDALGCVDGLLDAGFIKLEYQIDNIILTHETCGGYRNGSISLNLSNIQGGFSTTLSGSTSMANVTTYNNLAPGNYDIEIRSFSPVCNTFYKRAFTINAGPTIASPTVTDDRVCRYEVNSQNGGLVAACPPCPGGGTPTVTWWTSQTGGVKVYTGNKFNPITQNLINTSIVGTATFWAQCECNGCMSPRVKGNFVIKPRPEPTVTGENFPCPTSTQTYTTPSVSGSTYVWSLPDGGGSIVSTNNNTATIVWNTTPGGGPYRVRVVETNKDACSNSNDLTIYIKEINFACIGSINATIDNQCRFDLTDFTLLGRHYIGSQTYTFQLKTLDGRLLEQGTGHAVVDGIDMNGRPYFYAGKQLVYTITEPCGGHNCWGNIYFEDITPPTITCPSDITLSCVQVVDGVSPVPAVSGNPSVTDCSKTDITYTEIIRDANCLQPFTALPSDLAAMKAATFPTTGDVIKIILRTFIVKDLNNNTSTCKQYIFIRKSNLQNTICPKDFTLDCRNYTGDAAIDPTITGVPMFDVDGNTNTLYDRFPVGTGACKMYVTYRDERIQLCANSFKTIRTWSLFDPCAIDNPQTIDDERQKSCSQTILVTDKTPPSVSASFTQYYVVNNNISTSDTTVNFDGFFDLDNNSNSGTIQDVWALGINNVCGGKTRLTFRMKDESCTRTQVTISSSDSRAVMVVGYPQFNAAIGETIAVFDVTYTALGDYDVSFTATDECGFAKAKKTFRIKIRDNVKPNVVCKTYTQATLTTNGNVRAYAESFNNGSTDNCGVEKIEVRRMVNCQNPADTLFKPYVDFYCCDINTSVQVILRVWDAKGNYNECMVLARIDDKITPTCAAPPNKTISCTDYTFSGLQNFGQPYFWDNCRVKDTVYTEVEKLDNCKVGTLLRKWVVSDAGGLKDSCQQLITIRGKSDFTVDFPDDIIVNCFASIPSREQAKIAMLSNGLDKDGHIVNNGCGVMAVEIVDDTLTAVPDACYKILRKISVIDWCKYNPNNYDKNTGCYGVPVCGDIHSNPNWATQNLPAWQTLNRPGCTSPYERRFRDADDLGGTTSPYNPYAFSDGIICYTQIIKVVDNIAPTFTNCPADTIIKSYAALGCTDDIKLTVTASDQCAAGQTTSSDYLVFNWTLIDSATNQIIKTGVGNTLFEPFTYNKSYRVVWSVEDRCGNRTFCQQKVKVVDAKKPAIICKDVNAELMRDATGGGSIQVWATDILASQLIDNCTPTNYLQQRLVIEKDAGGTSSYPSVPNASVTFTCAQSGQSIPVRLWTMDAAGNADYCLAKVKVQDNMNICTNTLMASIQGTVKTEYQDNIAGVSVSATINTTNIGTTLTTAIGTYNINNLIPGNTYTIRAGRDDLPLNGVTTFDVALMSRHILGVEPLSSPYKIIAADVNRDGDVSAIDLLQMRRLILRLQPTFPNGTPSWRFVNKSYRFNNPANPLSEDFPEIVNFTNMPQIAQADFVGIKVGDVSGNAWTGATAGTAIRGVHKTLIFNIDDVAMEAGKEYKVTFKSDDFNAQAFQFTLNHTEGVEITHIENSHFPDMTENNFGRFKTALTTSWNGRFEGKSDNIITIVLLAKQNIRLSDVLTLGSNLTQAEAYDKDGEIMDVKLVFKGKNTEGGTFALYQNEPNPFDGQTKISFHLPTESNATLTIYDAAGRIFKKIEQRFAKGYNEVPLSKEDIKASGIVFYRLDTPTNSATKKMIIVQ